MSDRTCSVEGCERSYSARGWCSMHYVRWRINGHPLALKKPPTPTERFWRFVEKSTGCWLWTGSDGGGYGYGRFRLDGKMVRAHRWAYEEINGPIPEGLVLDHLCRVPRCVNPSHLEAVTSQENTLRGSTVAAAHAAKTHCKHGHPFDEANTRILVVKSGPRGSRETRQCRECYRLWMLSRRTTPGDAP